MLKDSDTPRYTARRSKRTYSADTKAELIAACLVTGASVAAIASAHGMNANVLHRWLKDQRSTARADGTYVESVALKSTDQESPSFIELPLTIQPEPVQRAIQVEVRKCALMMTVTWPISAASNFAQWSTAILK